MALLNFIDKIKIKIDEVKPKSVYQVAEIFTCKKTNTTKVLFRVSYERFTFSKYLTDVINDDELLDCLDSKSIRLLTYIATLEKVTPELSVISQRGFIDGSNPELLVKDKKIGSVRKITIDELSNDSELIKKFSQTDARKIGYFEAMVENNQEYALRDKLKNE